MIQTRDAQHSVGINAVANPSISVPLTCKKGDLVILCYDIIGSNPSATLTVPSGLVLNWATAKNGVAYTGGHEVYCWQGIASQAINDYIIIQPGITGETILGILDIWSNTSGIGATDCLVGPGNPPTVLTTLANSVVLGISVDGVCTVSSGFTTEPSPNLSQLQAAYSGIVAASGTQEIPFSSGGSGVVFVLELKSGNPQPPSNLTATYTPGVGVTLGWAAPAGVSDGISVYRIKSSSKNGVAHRLDPTPFQPLPAGTTSYVDRVGLGEASLTGDNIFSYFVTNHYNGVESVASNTAGPITFLG